MPTRICPTCGIEKQITQFKRGKIKRICRTCSRNQNVASGVCRICRVKLEPGYTRCEKCRKHNRNDKGLACMRKMVQARREANLCVRCANPPENGRKRYCNGCAEKYRVVLNRSRARRREKVIDHYGGHCVYCNESRHVFLTIDHINNDGAEHREQIGYRSIYPWLIQQGFPDGFQVACWNCNIAKHRIGEDELRRILAKNPPPARNPKFLITDQTTSYGRHEQESP